MREAVLAACEEAIDGVHEVHNACFMFLSRMAALGRSVSTDTNLEDMLFLREVLRVAKIIKSWATDATDSVTLQSVLVACVSRILIFLPHPSPYALRPASTALATKDEFGPLHAERKTI